MRGSYEGEVTSVGHVKYLVARGNWWSCSAPIHECPSGGGNNDDGDDNEMIQGVSMMIGYVDRRVCHI